jgi:hypothetical protein
MRRRVLLASLVVLGGACKRSSERAAAPLALDAPVDPAFDGCTA